jgi:hypothetical protein
MNIVDTNDKFDFNKILLKHKKFLGNLYNQILNKILCSDFLDWNTNCEVLSIWMLL